MPLVSTASSCPIDFRLVLHDNLSDSYELSRVLLAKAGFDGTLQLLTSAWERELGYAREELKGKTLFQLMWSNQRSAAAAVAAILDELDIGPVDVRGALQEWPGEMPDAASSVRQGSAHDVHRGRRKLRKPARGAATQARRTPQWRPSCLKKGSDRRRPST
jgi:hypothetical protein